MELIGVLAGAGVFAIVGILTIAMPEKFQQAAIRALESSPRFLKWLYFPSYLRSQWYVRIVRAIGVVCVLIAILAMVVYFKSAH